MVATVVARRPMAVLGCSRRRDLCHCGVGFVVIVIVAVMVAVVVVEVTGLFLEFVATKTPQPTHVGAHHSHHNLIFGVVRITAHTSSMAPLHWVPTQLLHSSWRRRGSHVAWLCRC